MKRKNLISLIALFIFSFLATGSVDMNSNGEIGGEIILLIILSIIIFAILIYAHNIDKKEKIKKKNDKINNTSNFVSDEFNKAKYFGDSLRYIGVESGIAFDPKGERFLIASTTQNRSYEYTFDKLSDVELNIDGNSVSSPSIGGAVIGGLLFGGAGAIVGGSNKTISKKIKNIGIKIVVNDYQNPFHYIKFFESDVEVSQEEMSVKNVINQTNEWYSRLLSIIKKKENVSATINKSSNIADELKKLSELVESEILTKEEFENQKKKLLNDK